DTQIQQVQPSTLNNIRRFITEWNQDPVSQTGGLVIMGTQVFMTNGGNTIPLLLPVEESYDDIPLVEDIEILNSAIPLSLQVEESLVPCNDILLFEDIEILAPVTENPNRIDHPNPLTTQEWKNQANEIATLLNHEGRGSKREEQ
ncbi:18450_t:CDS:2, partial [Gigaspora margarita]